MSLKIRLEIDEKSLRELEQEMTVKINNMLKRVVKENEFKTYNRNKLENLIDILIEKGIIEKSDII